MPQQNVALLAFNRGLISPLALARTDLKRSALSAEIMTNWMARALGSMMLRPGLGYLGSSRDDAAARFLPFVFSIGDTALVELTDQTMRIWIDDEPMTRPSVSTTVTNGTFASNLTGWSDDDEAGAASTWVSGSMQLVGTGTSAAIRRQTLTVASGDQSVEHALRIEIQRGPVTLRVGSTSGGDEYITETTLEDGTHSLAFTPTGASVYIQFSSTLERITLVDSCVIESAGVVEITAPWTEASLSYVREKQSGDVLFVACLGYQQRRIERRATKSWSVVKYKTDDGPFRTENTGPITITPSGLSGNITLTASKPLFRSGHVGALWQLTSTGQVVEQTATAQNTFTNEIRITGVDASRIYTIVISGLTASGSTVTLQRSLDEPGNWEDVPSKTWTADATETYDDGLDNQIVYYRIGVKTGDYVAGTIVMTLQTGTGSITGRVRITAFSSSTSVSAEVLDDLGDDVATDNWAEGKWSDYRGWPTAVAFVEGRLAWAGKNGVDISQSDAYHAFDAETEGDSGPISRTIGSGPVDTINWLLALQRLILGAEGAEHSARSSSFDEPMTPTNFQIKEASTQGSAAVDAAKIDSRGVYVQRGGTRAMELSFNAEVYDYATTELSALIPEIGQPGIVRIAVQRQPDTRIHFVRSDGTVAVLVFDRAENLACWLEVETDGEVEDVVVLPGAAGDSEDAVYYHVNRTIDGSTKRFLERWATESQCQGGTINRQADSFIAYNGPSTLTIPVAHLEGEEVVAWGGGADLGTFTVSSGQITLSSPVSQACVGIGYDAQWKSSKLAYAAGMGTGLLQKKKVNQLGVILWNTHHQGLQYGPDFDHLSDLPGRESGAVVEDGTIYNTYDEEAFPFDGVWDTDSRLCLLAQAPRPCTILAAVLSVETHDKH